MYVNARTGWPQATITFTPVHAGRVDALMKVFNGRGDRKLSRSKLICVAVDALFEKVAASLADDALSRVQALPKGEYTALVKSAMADPEVTKHVPEGMRGDVEVALATGASNGGDHD